MRLLRSLPAILSQLSPSEFLPPPMERQALHELPHHPHSQSVLSGLVVIMVTYNQANLFRQ